jgi:hypothetical protein
MVFCVCCMACKESLGLLIGRACNQNGFAEPAQATAGSLGQGQSFASLSTAHDGGDTGDTARPCDDGVFPHVRADRPVASSVK